MTSSKPVSVKKSQSAFRKHAGRNPKSPTPGSRNKHVTPPSSPPPFGQLFAIPSTSSDLPESPQPPSSFGGLQTRRFGNLLAQGASPIPGPSSNPSLSSPLSTDLEGLTQDAEASEDEADCESEHEDLPDLPIRNGVYWDTKLNCEARPVSKPYKDTIFPGPIGPRSKCICGQLTGGRRVPLRYAKKHEYKGPKFNFNENDGLYQSLEMPTLSTPFHSFKIGDKDVFQPIYISKKDYLAGARGPRLSSERSVPMCAHFPVTNLGFYNVPFIKGGRIADRVPNAQCMASRTQDQARMLCLIEDEVKKDGTVRRRMNIHAPPADWNNGTLISALNRWRAQFRQRKLGITSRAARAKWSDDALNYMVERLARDPTVYRADLSSDVTSRFKVRRTEHAVSCAIDNHKLRLRAEDLRARWEAEGLQHMFGGGDADIPMDDLPDSDDEIKDEDGYDSDSELLSSPSKHTQDVEEKEYYNIKMEEWAL